MQHNKPIGLTDKEVELYREEFGTNSSTKVVQNRLWKIILEIITEPLFIILSFCVILYSIAGKFNESIIMLIAIIFTSCISIYQQAKSKNAVGALQKLSTPYSKTLRNGKTVSLPTEQLVMHDIIIIEEGNIVPADAIIIEAHDLSIDESILTGESLPVLKESEPPNNTIFQGTMIVIGSGYAKVIAVGTETKLGKIGKTIKEIKIPKTPLQSQIQKFVRYMAMVGGVAFIAVWILNYSSSKTILGGLLNALTLAMSVLPEEIPVAFSTFMALGAYHLYKKKVIAISPYTVETLGAATIICTDKTGTITENKMELSRIYDFKENKTYDYTKGNPGFNSVLEYAMWASEMNPFDPMEKSIHQLYSTLAKTDKRTNYSMIHEYPLSGNPPIMTHVYKENNKTNTIIACKGSVEGVLNQTLLDSEQINLIKKEMLEFASQGLRVLGVSESIHSLNDLPVLQKDLQFNFIGLIAFYDPPKKNIKKVFEQFYNAGIKIKIITGDHPETTIAIGKQIGLKNSSSVLTGLEVMNMDIKLLCEKVNKVDIYARMFPEAKLKVIEALKTNNEVVAMTGDGVNDGPSLKAAHIGIAMGIKGSEIAKKAASLILMDDDLSHMVDAIAMGRRIYENFKKAIRYIVSIHIPIILIVAIPLLLSWKFKNLFTPIHVIFLELLMGPTCSIVFEREPIEANAMLKKPRTFNVNLFSFRELTISIIQGLAITIACLGLAYYFIRNQYDETFVRTIVYSTLIFSNLWLTLVNRSFYYSVFTSIQHKNNLLLIVLGASLLILISSIYLPTIQTIFKFCQLTIPELLLSITAAFVGVMWIELYKLITNTKTRAYKN